MNFGKKMLYMKLKEELGSEPNEKELNDIVSRYDEFDRVVSRDPTCVFLVVDGTAVATQKLIKVLETLRDKANDGEEIGMNDLMLEFGSEIMSIIGTAFSLGFTCSSLRTETAYDAAPGLAADAIRKAQQ